MSTIILEPDQRLVCEELRKISTIWELHEEFGNHWAVYLKVLLNSTKELYTINGKAVAIKPDFIIHLGIPGMKPLANNLLRAIRRLKNSDDDKYRDIYIELEELKIVNIPEAEVKGLYLLVAYTAEEKKVFDETT